VDDERGKTDKNHSEGQKESQIFLAYKIDIDVGFYELHRDKSLYVAAGNQQRAITGCKSRLLVIEISMHQIYKKQIPSTKFQINLKFQYSMTKTCRIKIRSHQIEQYSK